MPWEYHAYCRFMHLCVGLITNISVLSHYHVNSHALCRQGDQYIVTCHLINIPPWVNIRAKNGHPWSAHEDWHCSNMQSWGWQKAHDIWHHENSFSFVWVMAFYPQERIVDADVMLMSCDTGHRSVPGDKPHHTGHQWCVADTEQLRCHHIITCHMSHSPGPCTWPCVSSEVKIMKIIPDDVNTAVISILVIMLMIGIHMSLGNSWVPTLRPLPVCLTSWLLSPAHHLIIMTIITRLITQTPYTLHIRHYTTLASFFIHSVFSSASINIWTACRWWRLT